MDIQTKLFIDGEFVDAADGAAMTTLNPHDNSTICEIAEGGEADIDAAVDAAARAFPAWRDRAAAERGHLLLKLADAIERNAEAVARLESTDTGHPMRAYTEAKSIWLNVDAKIPPFYPRA